MQVGLKNNSLSPLVLRLHNHFVVLCYIALGLPVSEVGHEGMMGVVITQASSLARSPASTRVKQLGYLRSYHVH